MATGPTGLVILGFGGHARSVADVALAAGIENLRFVDPNAKPGETLAGFPVCSLLDDPVPQGWLLFPAAGDNVLREQQIAAVADETLLHTLISPRAYAGLSAKIGRGTLVAHQAHLGPMSIVGTGCIINTGAIVEHESTIGDYCHISVNATIAGRSRIGKRGFVGAGATVIDGIDIGDDITIGAGSVVVHSLREPGIYVGNPARRLR
jgi:sugar O-acyltransferase (sialic acid O-acetyltransferase NeuD family)